ncbi:MAG TPA: hypothetical protein VKG80_20235 [Trebonia sp.]|nr:hypothetical protein [Trebonia sp.]
MNDWDATDYAAKDNVLRVVRLEAEALFAMAAASGITSEGLSYAQEDVSGMPAVIEFDPGSLVLTAFGRVNAGTIRGDRAVADRFLNSFFRI